MDAEDGYQAATPAASSASALNAPSHTHSGPSPSGSAAECCAAGGRSRHGCSVGRPGTQGAGGRGLDALEWAHAVQGHLRGAARLLPAAWEASVAAGGDVIRAADGLEASGWPPGVPVLRATGHALFLYPQAPQAKQTNRPVATVTRKLRGWPEPWKGHNARTTWPPAGGSFDSSICRKENSRFQESENSCKIVVYAHHTYKSTGWPRHIHGDCLPQCRP